MREELFAPITGKVTQLENVPDPTFSQKLMGDGLAIEPTEGKVVSPVDGEIMLVAGTKHAIGIKGSSGVEILIHIGLETVALNGEGFEVHVKQGDKVKVGDLLVTMDLDVIREKAASSITPIIITNSDDFRVVEQCEYDTVVAGESSLFFVNKAEEEVADSQANATSTSSNSAPYRDEARDIVEAIGGVENIDAATHCVTRLRFALRDEDQVDKEKLENLNIVKGSFSANGQFQVIIGQGTVDKVYDAMVKETGISEATKDEVKEAGAKNNQNALQRGIKTLSDIFIPILPAIVTAGLLLGINNILVNPIFGDESLIEMYPSIAGIADMINIIASTAFAFLPALIGWSAVKRFGGSPLLGIVLGLVLVHPALTPAGDFAQLEVTGNAPTWNFFGLSIDQLGYQGQVLPVLVASWVLAKIEVWLRKRVADSIQLLVVAPVALLVTGLLSFIIIGPVTFTVGNWITEGIVTIFEAAPLVGGLLYGLLYAPLVITGMHHTFLAVDLQLIGTIGGTFLWPVVALSNIAQGSATFAIMLAARDEKIRGLAGTSGVSAYLGVTEPAMFGVNLRYRFPFYAAIVSTAIAGAFITVQNVLASSVGIGGIPAPLSISEGMVAFLIGMLIVIVLPFIITFIIAKRKLR